MEEFIDGDVVVLSRKGQVFLCYAYDRTLQRMRGGDYSRDQLIDLILNSIKIKRSMTIIHGVERNGRRQTSQVYKWEDIMRFTRKDLEKMMKIVTD